MRVRYLLPLAAAAGVALFAMAPVSAQEYPPPEPLLSVEPSTVVVGGTVVLTGIGYEPDEEVQIEVSTTPFAAPQLGSDPSDQPDVLAAPAGPEEFRLVASVAAQPEQTVLTDEAGDFTTTVKLTEVGRATITATGTDSGLSASVVVTVVKAKAGLPTTGTEAGRLLWIGGTAVGAGVLVLLLATLIWRRRHDHRADV